MKILVYSHNKQFKNYIKLCLEADDQNDVIFDYDDYLIDVAIIDLLNYKETNKVNFLIGCINVNKIICLVNAKDLYLNSNCDKPFSVYKNFKVINEIGEKILELENKIKTSDKKYVIFRVAELYGPNIKFGLIFDLLTLRNVTVNEGYRDFLYEGDFISAIEVAMNHNVVGFFDIANEKIIKIEELIKLVKEYRKSTININIDEETVEIQYECGNLKFYKWEPLVDLVNGIQFTQKLLKGGLNV